MTKEELLMRAIRRMQDYVNYYKMVADILRRKAEYTEAARRKDKLKRKIDDECTLVATVEDMRNIVPDAFGPLDGINGGDIQSLFGFEPKSFAKAYREYLNENYEASCLAVRNAASHGDAKLYEDGKVGDGGESKHSNR